MFAHEDQPNLEELRELLRDRNNFWFGWIDRALGEIKQFDVGGLDRLLAAFGGMGSFNDLVLRPANGQTFTLAETDINNRVERFRALCWELATDLRRELPA